MANLKEVLGRILTGLDAAEWAWRLLALVVVATGSTTAALLARGTDIVRALGNLGVFLIALLSALLLALLFYLIKLSSNQAAQAEYHRALAGAVNPHSINPVLSNFNDSIIPVEDLRLPGKQVHEHKHFRRCKFVGPGVLALTGGTYVRSSFVDVGDIIPLPDGTVTTGVVALVNCTVEDCEFFRTTLLVSADQARSMKEMVPGVRLAGEATRH